MGAGQASRHSVAVRIWRMGGIASPMVLDTIMSAARGGRPVAAPRLLWRVLGATLLRNYALTATGMPRRRPRMPIAEALCGACLKDARQPILPDVSISSRGGNRVTVRITNMAGHSLEAIFSAFQLGHTQFLGLHLLGLHHRAA